VKKYSVFWALALCILIMAFTACGGDVVETLGPAKGYDDFLGLWVAQNSNYTFTGNSFTYRDDFGDYWPGTFTFTNTQITFTPQQANTWEEFTLAYRVSEVTLELTGPYGIRSGTFARQPEPVFVSANPVKGFNYGYYYYVPATVKKSTYLLVETNNTGSVNDDINVHAQSAYNNINFLRTFADELGVVLLVPVFPRPASTWQMYTHALDRDTLQNNTGSLARIDLQLIQMIDDLRERCQTRRIKAASKVLLNGFSASGNFANRFTAIHPGRVQAVAAGGVNCMPILPANTLADENLIYPIGIYDIGTITGTAFNLAAYKTVPQYIFMGALDTNDTLPFDDAFSNQERTIIKKVLGENMQGRWEPSIAVYKAQGCSAVTFVKYPGVGHEYTEQIKKDLINFFRSNIR